MKNLQTLSLGALAAIIGGAACDDATSAAETSDLDRADAAEEVAADVVDRLDDARDAVAGSDAQGEVDAAPVVIAGSNSNVCLADMGLLQPVCPTDASSGLPGVECCNAFKKFQEDSCGCSPLIATLMGTDANGVLRRDQLVTGLNTICPVLGVAVPTPDCASPVTLSGIASGAARTYNGGQCEASDAEIDNLRYHSVLTFQSFFTAFADPSLTCVDFDELLSALAPAFDPDSADGQTPYILVPYGIGRYKTLRDMAEYLAMSVPLVVKDMWRVVVSGEQTADSMLYFKADGSSIVAGNHGTVSAYKDCAVMAEGYFESVSNFVGCSTTINHVKVPVYSEALSQPGKPTIMPKLIEVIYRAAASSDMWGAVDICKYHEVYCTGDNRQFDGYADCMTFMEGLPTISPACGPGGTLGGNSLACRFKHHFMTPFEPSTHCFHIGRGDRPDAHGHMKCMDDPECSTSDALGPAELLDFEQSDAGRQCIVDVDAIFSPSGVPVSDWPTITLCPGR